METFDLIVIGAGGAGMMCAARAARRGRRVLVVDHASTLGKKILISGGGRCNFTNIRANPSTYFSDNEHFAKSALARFTPADFIALIEKHGVPYYEKKLGQLFCVDSAQRIVDLLRDECQEAGAEIRLGVKVEDVNLGKEGHRFEVSSSTGLLKTNSIVIATGGLSMPKIGATDFGHQVAKKFGLEMTTLDPALVMLTFSKEFMQKFDIAGISIDAEVSVAGKKFRENILFTHSGLSGPAMLQVSLYWFPGEKISINLSPEFSLTDWFMEKKKEGSRKEWRTLLSERMSDRLATCLADFFEVPAGPVAQMSDQLLKSLATKLHAWELEPAGNGGYNRAEVTRGGVSTNELSSKTMEAKKVPGLYFIGEVVDVTGMLGGYNFQWAWASGVAAGDSV